MAKKGEGAEAAPAVDARGEITLPLEEGVEYGLRPSYEAIREIEASVRPLAELVRDADRGALSIDEMAAIACPLMQAWGRAHPDREHAASHKGAKPQRVAELIYQAGGPKIAARLLIVLLGALTGGFDASGEAQPAKPKTA